MIGAAASEIARRVKALFWVKFVWTLVLNLLFWAGYGWLSRQAVFPVSRMSFTWLDLSVPYAPKPWATVYLSQFLLTGGLPWLIDSRAVLYRYIRALAWLSIPSFLIFLLHPVASPRAVVVSVAGPMAWIAQMDGPYNAFPSLHAGFLMIMGGLAWRMFGRRPTRLAIAIFGTWGGAILYATLATRQHYAWDLAAGLLLGALANRLAWQGFTRSVPAPPEKHD